MSEKRIVVPEGMLKAAIASVQNGGFDRYRVFLEAALRWQSENPVEPTEADIELFLRCQGISDTGMYFHLLRSFGLSLQRRMFAAPEPEMHPILVKWLADAEAKGVDVATKTNYCRLFERAFEAGREEGPQ